MGGQVNTDDCVSGPIISYHNALLIVSTLISIFLLAVLALPASAGPASPDDFDPKSQLVDFNQMPDGIALAAQLSTAGLTAYADQGKPLLSVDAAAQPLPAPLKPIIVHTETVGATLVLNFSTPKNQVGINFRVPIGETVVLSAYDDQGTLLDQVQASGTIPDHQGRAVSEADFVGLALDQPGAAISRVTITGTGQSEPPAYDNLLVYPSQEDSVDISSLLPYLDPAVKPDLKLPAIESLLLKPSPATSQALLGVASGDPDPYMRERALLALAQHYDIGLLADYAGIALNDQAQDVAAAARNAVHVLREQWPIPDPPQIEVTATGPFTAGTPFTVAATLTSAVDRERVLLRHNFRNGIEPVPGGGYTGLETGLTAGNPLIWTVQLMAVENGPTELELVVELNLDTVDQQTLRRKLYITIDDNGGSFSTEPYPGLQPPVAHEIPSGGQQ
jgi:hypothetical protein